MSGLQRLEQRLESAISGVFARAFRSAVQPVEIAAALEREVDNNAQILSRDRRMVPNSFQVELSGTDLNRLRAYDSTLQRELSETLSKHAAAQGYVFPGPIEIGFEPADDLTTGRFRVRSRAQAEVISNVTATQVRRARALLEVNGTTQPLQSPGLVVGRGTEADLRINDPGVSRRHAEFVVGPPPSGRPEEAPHLEVRDLGSTNGITVDGRKTLHAVLHDGTHVKVGNTTMTVRIVETTETTEPPGQPGHYCRPYGGPGV